MKSELFGEVPERKERVTRIESLLIFAVTEFNLSVVSCGIRSDELMPYTKFRQCGFKQSRFVL